MELINTHITSFNVSNDLKLSTNLNTKNKFHIRIMCLNISVF